MMRCQLLFFVISTLASPAAHASDWKTTFVPEAVATYLPGEDVTLAIVPAGMPRKEANAAAAALSAAVRASRGKRSVVAVPRARALGGLKDAAIVRRVRRRKATHVLIVLISRAHGGPSSAIVSIYDAKGAQLGSFSATAATPLAPKVDATAVENAEQEVDNSSGPDEGSQAPAVATGAEEATADGNQGQEDSEASSGPDEGSQAPAEETATTASAVESSSAMDETAAEQEEAGAPATEPEAPKPEHDYVGLVLDVGVGLHSTSQAVGSGAGGVGVDESVALEVHPAYRITDSQEVGAAYFLNMYSMPESSSMKFQGVMAAWRYHVPFGAFDPFVELDTGWCWLTVSAKAGSYETSSTAQGVDLAAGLGLVYHIFDFLGVGAIARFHLPLFTSLCVDSGAGETCGSPSSNMKDISYGLSVLFNPFAL